MRVKGDIDEFIELIELEPGSCSIVNQSESSSLTIFWFQEDNNTFIIDGKNYCFNKHQIIFFTEFHQVKILKKGPSKFLRFNRPFFCIIDHDVEVSCKGILFFGASQLPVVTIHPQEIERFEILWKMFLIEMKSKDNLQISMLQMMLKRYLILSTRLYKEQYKLSKIKKENDLIREFNFLVEQHYATKHTVAEYSELLNKSSKTISNIFSKTGSKTPLSYIQDRKILEAKRLLHYTNTQIQEIAYKIGYDDVQTFSRFFKKKEGVSPTTYREKSRLG